MRWPDVKKFSKAINIPVKNLMEAFIVESALHDQIKEEECKVV